MHCLIDVHDFLVGKVDTVRFSEHENFPWKEKKQNL